MNIDGVVPVNLDDFAIITSDLLFNGPRTGCYINESDRSFAIWIYKLRIVRPTSGRFVPFSYGLQRNSAICLTRTENKAEMPE